MRISGTEPSLVILSQKKVVSKVENVVPKVSKQANPQNNNFNQFNTENFDALKTLRINRRTWLHVPSGTHWSTSSDTHQVVEI